MTDSQPSQATPGGKRNKSEYLPRQLEALRLMRSGKPFSEIAEILDYADKSGAYRAAMTALKGQVIEDADEVRTLEISRIDAMLQASWPAATATITSKDAEGDPIDAKTLNAMVENQLKAQMTVLKLMERRARYTPGVEAPVLLEVKSIEAEKAEAEELIGKFKLKAVESEAS